MKSLNDPILLNSGVFSREIIDHLLLEGFEYKSNDSYCYKQMQEYSPKVAYLDNCYSKYICSTNFTVTAYVFENGIGVDIDYNCGGNSSTVFLSFETFSFEEAYDKMVEFVNNYRK